MLNITNIQFASLSRSQKLLTTDSLFLWFARCVQAAIKLENIFIALLFYTLEVKSQA